jgi:hypothetical protein
MVDRPGTATLDAIDAAAINAFGGEGAFGVVLDSENPVDGYNIAAVKIRHIAKGEYHWTCAPERKRDLERYALFIGQWLKRQDWGRVKQCAETAEHLYGHLTVKLPEMPEDSDDY